MTWARVWSAKGEESASQFWRAERLPRLRRVVEVAVPAVAVLGELLQQHIVVVLDPHADRDQAQRVPAVRVRGRLEDGERVGGVDVGDAVGHEDDVVEGLGPLAAGGVGELHAEVEPGLHVRAAVRSEAADRLRHGRVVRGAVLNRVGMDHVVGEVHDGNAVARAEALADRLRRLAGDGDAVPVAHRARRVEHERDVERRVVCHPRRLEGNAGEVPVAVERMHRHVASDGEAVLVARRRVAVVEGVDPLLGAHGVGLHGVAVLRPGQR